MQLSNKYVTNIFYYNNYKLTFKVINCASIGLERALSGEVNMVSLML
jgi:hypothetical protein